MDLIAKEADVNAKDDVRYYTWIWFMMDRWIDMMLLHTLISLVNMWYLSYGAVLSLISNLSNCHITNLHLAFKNCCSITFFVSFFIQDGCTALMSAYEEGHVAVAEYLIAQGADLNAKNNVRYIIMIWWMLLHALFCWCSCIISSMLWYQIISSMYHLYK